MKSFVLYSVIVLVLSSITYMVLHQKVPECSSNQIASSDHTDLTIAAANQKINELEQRNAQLSEQLKLYQASVNTVSVDKIVHESSSAAKHPDTFPDAQKYIEDAKRVQEITDYISGINGKKGATLYSDLEKKFTTEPVDFPWADNYEQKLQTLFRDSSDLKLLVPQSIQCKTNRCQIKIPITSIDDANKAMEFFAKAMQGNNLNINKAAVMATPDLSAGITNIYIGKSEEIKLYE